MKKLAIIFISVVILFLAVQVIPVQRNELPIPAGKSFVIKFNVPDNVNLILQKSCYDCHSNHTNYPWYGNIQPTALLLEKHISEGRTKLNFDEFKDYGERRLRSKYTEIVKQIEQDKMPLTSYLWLHPEAQLSKSDKTLLIQYFQIQ
ncbi:MULTISPECIES: heme-binding domain-containing protein [unclassified Kaistella]|uniref:heme-binding domain-containing protein n=1 Tax=unclassified Kaistella TaxID=2762626 RepID=UPI0027322CBA|nr:MULTISPECIES: heme-binding domain-containing protein [unclassified Kaistella]MDP2454461.1 heme-binding domain-containing protein [Kaistella sp. SH11-4b]MDP2457199.1 heme-binding domain-containing protein [Kaistella sp. SH40-3]MDP2459959.1 heme-binding domain-containing protein [Kaistella sp. SH19-2b]